MAGERPEWDGLSALPGVADLPVPWPVTRVARLGLHASLRRFYRLSPDPVAAATAAASTDGPAPASLVLVLYEVEDSEAVARYRRSARWYQTAGVRVPRIWGSSDRALLVEDGGDRLLADQPADAELGERYVEATRNILAVQAHGLEAAGPNPEWSLDETRLRAELAHTEQHALRGWLDVGPSPRRELIFDRLAGAVAGLPARICHRDYHSRNLLVDDELMVLDFQDTMRGPLFYDLVSLLRDDYRAVPGEAAERALETYWSAARCPFAVDPRFEVPDVPVSLPDGARQAYALTGAQRAIKALGTFGYQVAVAGNHDYAPFARRTWRHARSALSGLGWREAIDELVAFERV